MTFFDRFFGPHATTPEWARFFTDDEFAIFMKALESELERRALSFELGDGVVEVELPNGDPHQLGLQNLAQLCHRDPPDKWGELISEHFENILRSYTESAELEQQEKHLDDVREMIKVRLYAEGYGAAAGEQLIHRPLAEGIEAALVYDLPTTVRSVARGRLDAWGLDEDDLFRIALENIAHEPSPERRKVEVGGDAHIEALLGESFFVTSQALRLESFLDAPAPHGALLALPHRHALLFHPIRNLKVVPAINGLITMAFGMFQEGPGSLTSNLYWWHQGKLTRLPTDVTANRVLFEPPAEFMAVLDALGANQRGRMN